MSNAAAKTAGAGAIRAAVVLPVKRFDAAKSRLGEALGAVDRSELAAAMLADVIAQLGRCELVEQVYMVSSEPLALRLGARIGAVAVDDRPGHSAAAAAGVEAAIAAGFSRLALLAGDCPLLEAAEVEALLRRPGAAVVVLADRHGSGTNGLVLTPPDAIEPAFGPGSRRRHLARAAAAGVSAQALEGSSMELDLDGPDDLDELRRRLRERPGAAPATAAVLAHIEFKLAPGSVR